MCPVHAQDSSCFLTYFYIFFYIFITILIRRLGSFWNKLILLFCKDVLHGLNVTVKLGCMFDLDIGWDTIADNTPPPPPPPYKL